MANATLLRDASESVSARLAPFRGRASRLIVARTGLLGLLMLLLALLAAMWLDLMWPVPISARWAVTRIGPFAALVAIVATCWWRTRRLAPEQLALWIDTQAGTGGETLAGWQLERRPPGSESALSRGLAELASARAGERLRKIAPESVLPADLVRKAAWLLCGSILLTAALSALMPAVAWNQWQRFLFPSRDVPPFTGVTIELNPLATTVRYGESITIQATVTAGRAEFIELVTLTPDGSLDAMPMLQEGSDKWQAVLLRLTAPLEYYARSGRSRSRIGRLEVQMTPQILSTRVRITPPPYTQRPVFEGALPREGITGLAGTEVEFLVTSNRPLREGRLLLESRDSSHEEVMLAPITPAASLDDDATTVQGTIRLDKPGRFDLSVFDEDGLESLDRVSGTITIAVDQRPVVRILEPKPVSLATPDVRLPVVVAAEDDFGITSLQLYRSLNGSSATALPSDVDGGPAQSAEVELPLDRYGLLPGDEIRLFARAEDNDPAGAKGAESPVTVVRIISTEQFQEMMLRQQGAESIVAKYRTAERYLERLAEALRDVEEAAEAAAANPDSPSDAQELQKRLEAAQQAAAEAAKAMRQLAEQPMPIDVDRELARRLAKLADDTGRMATQLGEMAEAQGGSRQLTAEENAALRKLAENIADRRGQLDQQAIQPLETLQHAMPLIIDAQGFAELAAQQRDLAQRLDSLRSSPDANDPKTQRRVAELEVEQQRLRESLSGLLDDIAAHADALPHLPELEKLRATANEFVDAVRDSQALAAMAAAQQHLLSSDFPGAVGEAGRAADILESFLSKCDSLGQTACDSCELAFNPSAGCPSLGNSIEQMLAMMGMKPGTRFGGGPGMGFGFGAGGGYSVRSPGPHNVGMYGSLPMAATRSSRGRGDRRSQGTATNSGAAARQAGRPEANGPTDGHAAGGAASNVPPQYRSQVAEYFRQLAEQLGEQP